MLLDDGWVNSVADGLTKAEWAAVARIGMGAWATIGGYIWVCPPLCPTAVPIPPGKTWPTGTGPTVAEVIEYHQAGFAWTGWLRAGRFTKAGVGFT